MTNNEIVLEDFLSEANAEAQRLRRLLEAHAISHHITHTLRAAHPPAPLVGHVPYSHLAEMEAGRPTPGWTRDPRAGRREADSPQTTHRSAPIAADPCVLETVWLTWGTSTGRPTRRPRAIQNPHLQAKLLRPSQI